MRSVPAVTPANVLTGLIDRMNHGDREAAGIFLDLYGPLIRRRIRGKISASLKRIADTGDILSTLSRRLDLYILNGRFECHSEDELWSLVNSIAKRSTIEKARILNSINRLESEDGPLARRMQQAIDESQRRNSGSVELAWEDAMDLVTDPIDREIVFHWTLGCSHPEIGEVVGLSAVAVRKRWERIKVSLREKLGVGTL